MTYQDQIKSPKWQKKRLEVLEMNKFECQRCGSSENQLHVHHCYYKKGAKIWEYKAEDLMCLCEKCHKETHGIQDSILFLLGWMQRAGTGGLHERVLGYIEGLIAAPQPVSRSEPFMQGYIDGCSNWHLSDRFAQMSENNAKVVV